MTTTPLKILTGLCLGMLLLACQAESSAQTANAEAVVESAVDTAVESAESAVAEIKEAATQEVKDAVKEAAEVPTEKVEPVASEVASPEKASLTPPLQALNEKHYTVLDSPITVSTGDKIEVAELFWYGCGHCFSLERPLNEWKKKMPANAEFVKVPAVFSARWEFHAKAYYTMQALGVLEQTNNPFFQRIHVLRKPINDLDALTEFLADYDQTAEAVESAFNSFAVDSNLRNAKLITAKSTATGVPAILVDGKYHTSGTLAGSTVNLFTVIEQLIEKSAGER